MTHYVLTDAAREELRLFEHWLELVSGGGDPVAVAQAQEAWQAAKRDVTVHITAEA